MSDIEGTIAMAQDLHRLRRRCKELELDNEVLKTKLFSVEKDNTKLRTKVEQNIPVERIEGLDAYIFGKEIGKGVQRLGQIREDGLGFEKNVSIEDHEGLKKDFEKVVTEFNKLGKVHNDLHKEHVCRMIKLEKQVAELSKRPVSSEFVNLGQINGNSSWARIEDLKPGPGPQA